MTPKQQQQQTTNNNAQLCQWRHRTPARRGGRCCPAAGTGTPCRRSLAFECHHSAEWHGQRGEGHSHTRCQQQTDVHHHWRRVMHTHSSQRPLSSTVVTHAPIQSTKTTHRRMQHTNTHFTRNKQAVRTAASLHTAPVCTPPHRQQ